MSATASVECKGYGQFRSRGQNDPRSHGSGSYPRGRASLHPRAKAQGNKGKGRRVKDRLGHRLEGARRLSQVSGHGTVGTKSAPSPGVRRLFNRPEEASPTRTRWGLAFALNSNPACHRAR